MKPNIILIVMDSLRFDHLGMRKNGGSLTPNLDRLAKEAFLFTHATAQGPSTRVSMSAMLSSTFASMYGGEQKLSPYRPVVQEMLKEAGYVTAGVTANLYLSRYFGWSRGFDHYDDCRPEAIYQRKLGLRLVNQLTKRLGQPLVWPRSLPAELVFENANLFLRRDPHPFFMWVHLMDTHWPYTIQKFSYDGEFRRQRKVDISIRPRLVADQPSLTAAEAETLAEQYRTSVAYTDAQVGNFIRSLDARGLRKETWVVLTADHGEEFLDHGRFFHHPTPYEELAHVPLMILPPTAGRMKGGKVVDTQVRLVDLVPTFLELAESTPDAGRELVGRSLVPAFEGRRLEDCIAITESPHNQCIALREGPWKYIWNIPQDLRMLFNLEQDPYEKENLGEKHPARAGQMHALVEGHLEMVRRSAAEMQHLASPEDPQDEEMTQRLRDLGYVE